MDWQYTLSGLLVGTIVGMTGVGGGSLMTPLLVMLFGIAPAVAREIARAPSAKLPRAGPSHHRRKISVVENHVSI